MPMPLLRRLATLFALLGCLAASAVALMTVTSIGVRASFSRALPGDIELSQLGIALAISLCLPWAQVQRANIIVDFFTQGLREVSRRRLDAVGSLLMALMCAVLAWRTAVGAMSVREAHETTMILALPMWPAYAALAPGLALAACIAVLQAWALLGREGAAR